MAFTVFRSLVEWYIFFGGFRTACLWGMTKQAWTSVSLAVEWRIRSAAINSGFCVCLLFAYPPKILTEQSQAKCICVLDMYILRRNRLCMVVSQKDIWLPQEPFSSCIRVAMPSFLDPCFYVDLRSTFQRLLAIMYGPFNLLGHNNHNMWKVVFKRCIGGNQFFRWSLNPRPQYARLIYEGP